MTRTRTGGCVCGRVRYTVNGALRPAVACHCRQCRRYSGHHWVATRARREDFRLDRDEGLRWFESSPGVRRAFCGHCGSMLFFDRVAADGISIGVGSLDEPTGLQLVGHIYTAEAGDYYKIADGLPCEPGAGKMPAIPEHDDPE